MFWYSNLKTNYDTNICPQGKAYSDMGLGGAGPVQGQDVGRGRTAPGQGLGGTSGSLVQSLARARATSSKGLGRARAVLDHGL